MLKRVITFEGTAEELRIALLEELDRRIDNNRITGGATSKKIALAERNALESIRSFINDIQIKESVKE